MQSYLIIAAAALFSFAAAAQQNTDGEILIKNTTFLLPNGKRLSPDRLDSLQNAWGRDRVLFSHSTEDDQKGIIRLVRKTDGQISRDNAYQQEIAAMIGKQAPQFELTDLQGRKWSLKELRGKVVVLNFWFTSCPPCVAEMPELNKLVEHHKGKDVVFLALTYNDRDKVNSFLNRREFNYTILTDSEAVDVRYNVNVWPTSMVIDKNGIIRFAQITGEAISERVTSAIHSAL